MFVAQCAQKEELSNSIAPNLKTCGFPYAILDPFAIYCRKSEDNISLLLQVYCDEDDGR